MEKFQADVVSIPSRGSGKGDVGVTVTNGVVNVYAFQSPLGEVVKKTMASLARRASVCSVSIPSRGTGKGDTPFRDTAITQAYMF
jgi:hypothetical protein